jgi:hypothetical protein
VNHVFVGGSGYEDAVGSGVDVMLCAFERRRNFGVLSEPVSVDPGVDENVGTATLDASR